MLDRQASMSTLIAPDGVPSQKSATAARVPLCRQSPQITFNCREEARHDAKHKECLGLACHIAALDRHGADLGAARPRLVDDALCAAP
jgi:hypothetical protein